MVDVRGGRHVNGIMLSAEIRGEDASRPPLLLLHGFTGSAAMWAAHLPALRAHVTAVAVDLIGHGFSSAPPDPTRYTMTHCVNDLLALLDELGTERAGVLGYSMGARVALHLAAAAPDRVAALILESGSPGLATEEERVARRAGDEALALRIEREGVETFIVDYWERLPLFATQQRLPSEVRDALRRARLRNRASGLANSLRGMGTGAQAPLWDRLGAIAVPALLIAGALDDRFCAVARAMAAALPQARAAVVPDAGHAVHLEQPDVFDRLVIGFLRERYKFAPAGARQEE